MPTDATAATQAAPSLGSAEAPQVLGERYEILGLLGSGGMGNVYKARDRELDELVALKVLRPELVGAPGAIERFRREVKLARRVTHPNVARVFDIGERGGDRLLTMELVDGEPLSARLAREGRLSVAAIVEIASAICAGLGAAHAAGVIHRDLKPDNVLLEKGGRVVLTDFGIACAAARGDAVATSAFVGSPAYMAPEQIEGAALDARTDLYALGAMLFELATGTRPWQGATVLAVAAARLLHPPPDPRASRPDLPAALAAVVLRCMARRPDERYASAAEVAGELASMTLPVLSLAPLPRLSKLEPEPARAREKRVAVLPFRNAGAPEQAYLADGLTEDVIDQLSMVPGLRVRSRGVVMRYKETDRDPRELGRELDVQVVVDGTVRKLGGGVRISARLASVADGVQLWARRFDRPDSELLGVSDDVARAIAEALAVEVTAPARPLEADPEAMDLYLRARAAHHVFFDDLEGGSLALLERALERAPDEPRILAAYAMTRARVQASYAPGTRSAEVCAAHAVALAPGSPHAHVALATVRYQAGEEAGSVRSLRHALRLAPDNADAHELLGRILAETSLLGEARRHLEAALALEPEMTLARLSLARTHELLGEPDEADRLAAGRSTMLPLVGRILTWRRDARAAAALLATVMPSGPGSPVSQVLLHLATGSPPPYAVYARFDDPARSTLRVATFFAQLEAEGAAFFGDAPRALAAITRAADLALFDVAWLDRCPLLADLRGLPAFVALRARAAARAQRAVEAYRAAE